MTENVGSATMPVPTSARHMHDDRCLCGEELVRINLLIDGEAITMCSCSLCDRRSWRRDGQEIQLGGVLHDISSIPTRYRRNLANR